MMIGSQSTAKTVFLLASMVGWLIVGAAMMYLFPAIADGLVGSELTHLWMANLSRSGYNPALGWVGGWLTLALTLAGNWVGDQNVPQRVDTDRGEGDRH
jgi:hypothetical protein